MSSIELTAAPVRAVSSRKFALALDPARAVLALIVIGTIVRLVLAASVGLGSDESYTVANARTLALSYVDYPPLHAWIVGIWAQICGSEAPLVVRLPFIALFAGSTWLMFRLASFLFGQREGMWAALLFNLAPVFTLPHASWVLPDGPLIFFMLAGAYVTARLLFADAEPSRDILQWCVAGAFAGLAMLSKYHGVFLLAGVFVFLLTWRPRMLATPAPWLGVLASLAVFAPVIVWNANHDWVGLFFQSNRLTSAPHIEFMRVFDSIGAQAGYLAPWLFLPLGWFWIASLRHGPADARRWFLALIASGPILFFTLANIVSKGLPHWPMPGWLFLFPILGAEAARIAQTRPRLLQGAVIISAAALIAVAAVLGTNARTGWLIGNAPEDVRHTDPTLDLMNWSELKPALAARHLLGAQTPVIAATHWAEAGKLNYIMGRNVSVLCLCADPQQFRYLQNLGRFAGRDIAIVGVHREPAEIESTLGGQFDRFETLAPILLHRDGHPAIELTIIRGINFHPTAALSQTRTNGAQG
jgi:hypothetical protein